MDCNILICEPTIKAIVDQLEKIHNIQGYALAIFILEYLKTKDPYTLHFAGPKGVDDFVQRAQSKLDTIAADMGEL